MIRLDSVTCVVDSDQAFDPDQPELFELQLRQIGFSDLIILNKIDLAGVEGTARVKRVIDQHYARVRLVPAINCEVPLEILVSVGRFDHAAALLKAESEHDQGPDHAHDHGHHNGNHGAFFSTWSYESDRPFDRKALQDMIKRRLPANIYRCKGFIYAADDPDNRYVLQVVGRRVELTPDRAWGDATRLNRIVAIAHQATLDGDELITMFDECAVQLPVKNLIA
jgi:G3E family GTPase